MPRAIASLDVTVSGKGYVELKSFRDLAAIACLREFRWSCISPERLARCRV